MTVVHNPEDARIRQRQINALIAAGWKVTYAAPFRGLGLDRFPGAAARSRRATVCECSQVLRQAPLPGVAGSRAIMRALAKDHDVVLVHDPELV